MRVTGTRHAKRPLDGLLVEDLSVERTKAFLADLQQTRHCGISTRNQRLAAIRSLAHFIGQNSPEHLQCYTAIHTVPFKKAPQSPLTYLEKPEMDALLEAAQGSRTVYRHMRRNHQISLLSVSHDCGLVVAPRAGYYRGTNLEDD